MTLAARRHLRPWKERQVRAGISVRICVEQMIGARIVLINASFHQPHSQNAGIEIQVLLRRSGDRRDVMKSVDGVHRANTIARRLRGRYCK